MAWSSSRVSEQCFLMSDTLAWNDFPCGVWAEAPEPSPVPFFHWLQDTWLALSVKQQDLFPWMREHTLSPLLLGWHDTDVNKWPFTFHLHVNQPLGINIKKIPTQTSWRRTQEETKWALQPRIHSLGWFSFALQVKRCVWHFSLTLYLLMCLSYKEIMNPYLGSIRLRALRKSEPDQSSSCGQLEL